jgi:GTP cyclohydrolase IB
LALTVTRNEMPMPPIQTENLARVMPDIANEARPALAGQLEWVGMSGIDVPIEIADGDGRTVRFGARVDAYVNLSRPDVRGIHMSRLYLHVDRALAAEPVSPCSLRRLLKAFLDSHAGLSDRAMVALRFDYLVRRPALVSDNTGWKSYPVTVRAQLDRGQFTLELGIDVAYSSTCPCSAALARQLVQEDFAARFGAGEALDRDTVLAWLGTEQGIGATPHSQRSRAEVRARLAPSFANLPVLDLVDLVEGALQTPVQAAVKREDEQAFARLNGRNLMFCEDAARRMQDALDGDDRIADFWLRASHFESLHPHDAVAVAVKGVPGGYDALG